MKLKIGDKVYLQKYDVSYLLHHIRAFPSRLMEEIFCGDDDLGGIFWMNGGADGLSFDQKFEDKQNVEWLLAQDYILNFEDFKDKSIEELEVFNKEEEARGCKICNDFNGMPEEYRKEHYDETEDTIKRSNAKRLSYNFMIAYLSGEREFIFPKGYEHKKPAKAKAGKTVDSRKVAEKNRICRKVFNRKNKNSAQ